MTLGNNFFVKVLKKYFVHEWSWRLYVVLQVIGLVGLVYLDVTNKNWSIVPDFFDYRGRLGFYWDIFKEWHWTRYHTNWYAIIFLFGPFVIAKSLDWISEARR